MLAPAKVQLGDEPDVYFLEYCSYMTQASDADGGCGSKGLQYLARCKIASWKTARLDLGERGPLPACGVDADALVWVASS